MKLMGWSRNCVLAFALSWTAASAAQEPLAGLRGAIVQGYGQATLDGLRLLKGEGAANEPFSWTAFAVDPHRPGDLIKLQLERVPGQATWSVRSSGAGDLLSRMPPVKLDLARVKVGPMEALRAAQQAAALAKASFVRVAYQLVTQTPTAAPEWALLLLDAAGKEVGFVVLSAESGAVTHQDFSIKGGRGPGVAGDSEDGQRGEEAAKAVKEGARRAWDWTERAGRETKGFFKELFR